MSLHPIFQLALQPFVAPVEEPIHYCDRCDGEGRTYRGESTADDCRECSMTGVDRHKSPAEFRRVSLSLQKYRRHV